MAKVSGIAVAEILAGTVLFWSGFKGNDLQTTLKDLLKGQQPPKSAEAPPSLGVTNSSSTSSSGGGGGGGGVPFTGPGKYSGPNLTAAQMANYWRMAGGPANVANIAGAIGIAESGGNANATNPNDNGGTQTSWGLWQISLGNHNAPSSTWYNPLENARLAVGKYKGAGNSFSPWGTYTSGAYLSHL